MRTTPTREEWHVPNCENIKTPILFDSVKFSKATSTKTSSHLTEISNPASAFAQSFTDSDIQRLNEESKNAGSCSYLQNLLE